MDQEEALRWVQVGGTCGGEIVTRGLPSHLAPLCLSVIG